MDGADRTWGIAREGTGRPAVFLHGGPGLYDYGSLLTPETVGWQLIHYQQRGLPPAPTTEPFTLEQHLADLLSVLDSVGIARVILIGHSWGASLGLFAAMEASRRVSGLVLVDPLGTTGDGGARQMNQTLTDRLLPEYQERAAAVNERLAGPNPSDQDGTEYLALRWPGYFADPRQAPPLPVDFRLSLAANGQTMASLFSHIQSGTFAEGLPHIEVPVEFVLGEQSPLPNAGAFEAAATLPHSHVTVVPRAGHLPWYEQPGCVADALTRVAQGKA